MVQWKKHVDTLEIEQNTLPSSEPLGLDTLFVHSLMRVVALTLNTHSQPNYHSRTENQTMT